MPLPSADWLLLYHPVLGLDFNDSYFILKFPEPNSKNVTFIVSARWASIGYHISQIGEKASDPSRAPKIMLHPKRVSSIRGPDL